MAKFEDSKPNTAQVETLKTFQASQSSYKFKTTLKTSEGHVASGFIKMKVTSNEKQN